MNRWKEVKLRKMKEVNPNHKCKLGRCKCEFVRFVVQCLQLLLTLYAGI